MLFLQPCIREARFEGFLVPLHVNKLSPRGFEMNSGSDSSSLQSRRELKTPCCPCQTVCRVEASLIRSRARCGNMLNNIVSLVLDHGVLCEHLFFFFFGFLDISLVFITFLLVLCVLCCGSLLFLF